MLAPMDKQGDITIQLRLSVDITHTNRSRDKTDSLSCTKKQKLLNRGRTVLRFKEGVQSPRMSSFTYERLLR